MPKNIDLSIVIPVYNEQNNVQELYQRIKDALKSITVWYEVVFVNDGSTDKTISIIKALAKEDEKIKYLSFSRNFGHQIAIYAGIEKANGEQIVIMDGDLQDPPELIKDLYAEYQKGYEIVYAQRQKRLGENIIKNMTAKLYYRLFQKISSVALPLDTGDFRIISRKVADYLINMPEANKFLRGQIAWLGLPQSKITFIRPCRKHGKGNYTIGKLAKLATDGIIGFSDLPIKIPSIIGLVFIFLACFVFSFSLYYFIQSMPYFNLLLIAVLLFIGGAINLSIGIIGQYLVRIQKNNQNRPKYIVLETNCK